MSDAQRKAEVDAGYLERERAYTFIGFPSDKGSSYPIHECADCGSVITSTTVHARWHDVIAELVAELAGK